MSAQNIGRITYRETIHPEQEDREPIEHTWEMFYNDSLAVCQFVKPEDKNEFSSGGMQIFVWMNYPEDVFTTDILNKKLKDYRPYLERPFLVEGDWLKYQWKMTGKQGVVLGFPCMEATTTTPEGTKVLAWFTPRIKLQIGPKDWRGLPGTILYMEIDGGKTVIAAIEIDGEIPKWEQPDWSDAKVMSPAEYNAMRAEKEAERKSMYGN